VERESIHANKEGPTRQDSCGSRGALPDYRLLLLRLLLRLRRRCHIQHCPNNPASCWFLPAGTIRQQHHGGMSDAAAVLKNPKRNKNAIVESNLIRHR
jgi:hypothetical protein